MTTNRTPIRRASRGALSSDQEQCLWLGVGRNGFPFEDEDASQGIMGAAQARGSWKLTRVMGTGPMLGGCTTRPRGSNIDYETRAQSRLFEARPARTPRKPPRSSRPGRAEFDRCHAPDFTYCGGPGLFLRGREAARQAHLEWADVPASLIPQWSKPG